MRHSGAAGGEGEFKVDWRGVWDALGMGNWERATGIVWQCRGKMHIKNRYNPNWINWIEWLSKALPLPIAMYVWQRVEAACGVGAAATKTLKTPSERIPTRQPGGEGNKNKLMFSSVRHFGCGHRCETGEERGGGGGGERGEGVAHTCSTRNIAHSFTFYPIRLLCCHSAICPMMQCGRFLFMIAQIS